MLYEVVPVSLVGDPGQATPRWATLAGTVF